MDQPALSEIRTTADHSIDVAYHGFDDFGCSALHMISQKNGEPPSIKQLPHEPKAELIGELSVDLNELDVTTGDQITVWLSISDSRPDKYGGPQLADSRKIRVQVADDSIPVGQQVVQNETQALLDNLIKALDDLKIADRMTDDLQADLGEVDDTAKLPKAPVDAVQKAKRLQDRIKDAEQALRRLSDQGELAPQRLFQEEIERIQEVTDNEVAEAKKQSGLVPLSDDLPQQQEAIAATNESLRDAIDKLEQVRADVEERGKQLELAAQLDELAKQQERLAEVQTRGEVNAPNVQKQQQQVADALQEVVEQDLDAKSEQFAQRAEEAAKLTEAAAELQQQQETLAKLDQVRSKEERDDKLLEMIAREQEQIANETRMLEEQRRDIQPPAADARETAPGGCKRGDRSRTDEKPQCTR